MIRSHHSLKKRELGNRLFFVKRTYKKRTYLQHSKEYICPRVAGELESDSVALERIREYDELPQEKDWNTSFPIDEVYNNY